MHPDLVAAAKPEHQYKMLLSPSKVPIPNRTFTLSSIPPLAAPLRKTRRPQSNPIPTMRPLTSNPIPTLRPLILLLLLLIHLPPTLSLGINCRGSFECNPTLSFRHPYPFIPAFASLLTNGTPPGTNPATGGPLPLTSLYQADNARLPHIACDTIPNASGGFCLFLQGSVPSRGVSGEVVRERIKDLVDHGCQECGSVPLSGDNDPDKMGILTVNWVGWTGGCEGVCAVQKVEPQAGWGSSGRGPRRTR